MAADPVLEVVAALVFRAGRLLITQRRPHDHLGGCWEFPGGKIEPGETPPAALRRELQEELNLEVQVGPALARVTHAYPEHRVALTFFRCQILRGEPVPVHCAALAWVTAPELDRYPFPDADARLLARLKAEPDWWKDP